MERVTANLSGAPRRAKLQGRDYIVAPLTLIVPGVLNGSQGPLYYPPEEISKNPGAWNGVPIVVDHPTHQGGHVSARDPDVLNKQWVGYVFRSKANGKLMAEGWFDVAAIDRVDNRILPALEARKEIELSTGLFTDNEAAEKGAATDDGKPYTHIARNYRPDHLALLLDQIGACSVDDGCGVNVNQSQDRYKKAINRALEEYASGNKPFLLDAGAEKLLNNLNKLANKGDSEMSKLSDDARKKIVDDLIANSCCWNEADREVLNGLDDGKLGQFKAQADGNNQHELVANAATKGFTDPGGNSHTYNEKEGKWESKIEEPELVLNAAKEEQLKKMGFVKQEKDPPKPQTTEEWLKATNAPPQTIENVRNSEKIVNREKAALIEHLTANIKDDGPKQRLQERLQAKSLDELGDLMALAPEREESRPISYAGAAAPAMNRSDFDEDDVLPLPVMNFEPEKQEQTA